MRKSVTPQLGEDALHFAVADFLRLAWPQHLPWWHTPNGGKRETITRTGRDGVPYTFSPEAAKLKRMGALAGVPDLTFVLPNGQVAFIELKAPKGSLSDEQVTFRERAIALKCGFATCRSVEEVEATLSRWLGKFGLALRATTAPRRPGAPQSLILEPAR